MGKGIHDNWRERDTNHKKVMLWFKKAKAIRIQGNWTLIGYPGRVSETLTRFLIQSSHRGEKTDNYFARSLCQKHVVWRNKVGMLVTRSKSLIWFRSIFSSDKAESGNKLGRGRKPGRWGREKTRRKKKKKWSIRKFNQIGTNGICFSVSPTPTCKPSEKRHTHTHTHSYLHLLAGTGQHKYLLMVSRDPRNFNSIYSIISLSL